MTNIRLRDDLAEQELRVPAGLGYSDYDDLHDDFYLSADDLKGATLYEDDEDPDSHAFCKVKLTDGRILYMMGVDLDFEEAV